MFGSLRWILALATVIWTANCLADNFPKPERLTGMNPCIPMKTCHDCIQTPSCAWCSMPDFKEKRCFLPNVNTKISADCPNIYTINPDTEYVVVRNKSLTKGTYVSNAGSSVSGASVEYDSSYSSSKKSRMESIYGEKTSSKQEAVQISPQEVNLKLRIREVHKLHMFYAQAEDYPVDLYYLMDLSFSMMDDKQKLSDLGQLLVESMSKITSNFRLGFGSFVDKVVMPYVSVIPEALQHPCTGCAPPYGYKNVMPLSQNASQFAAMVRDASVSGNLDGPEGGFDAIMQAIACRDEIGWREKARKLLVFSTDACFHYAGDGKLGGIITPNDGCCHLDRTGLYTHSSVQDYPSISQINLKVKESAINIIWAVTEEQIWIYSNLTKHIEGSYAGKLSEDSSNIVELIREQYAAITSSIEMKDTASSAIKVRYFSSCVGTGPRIETNRCDGLKVGTKVEFRVEIEVLTCPKNRSEWFQKFQIYPVGINESLTVNLEMLCDCQCERDGNMYEEFSPKCRGIGTLKCGICECPEGYFGNNCECNPENGEGESINNQFCRPDNTTLVDCSGRGSCICNVCECNTRDNKDEIISGQYCECDNFSCDRNKGELCSNNGICNCGRCQCNPGWTGTACECRNTTSTCIAPGTTNGVLCSGHGDCVCGECKCHVEGEIRYSGKHCTRCPTCPSRCEELKPCVLCQAFKLGNFSKVEDCATNCTEFVPEIVEQLVVDVDNDETVCFGYDEEDCKYTFVYYYNETELQVRVQAQRECPPQVFMLGIVLGVIAAIVLIGLAFLLLWKLLTTIHDRREVVKFDKERMMAKWDTGENPIYKQATSTFINPQYAGK